MTDRPLIIVGCPRSGTTLLSTMLHAHPQVAIAPETRFLLPLYRHRHRFGDLSEPANRRRLARAIMNPARPHTADLGIDRRTTIRRIVAGPPTIGSAFAIVWDEFARSRGKARWGEKRPKYWRTMSSIHRLFPDAQFVHLVRDPRSCVASLLASPWWPYKVEHSLTTWLLAEREIRRFSRSASPGTYHRLRYEDLLADPRGVLTALTDFLQEPFDDAMLEPASAAADIVPARMVWHDRTRGELDPSRSTAWRKALRPADIGLIEYAARRPMERHGYPGTDLGTPPSPQARAHFRVAAARHDAILRKEQLTELAARRREPNPVGAVPTGG